MRMEPRREKLFIICLGRFELNYVRVIIVCAPHVDMSNHSGTYVGQHHVSPGEFIEHHKRFWFLFD